ncbi:MAG: alpha/beta hydrolase [Bacilli bacterium]
MFNKYLTKQILDLKEKMRIHDEPFIKSQSNVKDIDVFPETFSTTSTLLKQNFYINRNKEDLKPLLIVLHGGAWIYGDENLNGLYAMDFARRGYLVVSINYRLIPEVGISEMVQDVFASISNIVKLNNKYSYDKNNITLAGNSAGGHLALLFDIINENNELQALYKVKHIDIKIKNLILNHPAPFVRDMKIMLHHNILNKIAVNKFNNLMINKNKSIKNAYSFEDISSLMNKVTNILIVTSKGDSVVGDQAFKLKELFIKDDISFSFYYESSPDAIHVFNVTAPNKKESIKCNDEIDKFIKNTK